MTLKGRKVKVKVIFDYQALELVCLASLVVESTSLRCTINAPLVADPISLDMLVYVQTVYCFRRSILRSSVQVSLQAVMADAKRKKRVYRRF